MASTAAPPDNSDLNDAIVGTAPLAPTDNSDLNDAVVGHAAATPPAQPQQPPVQPEYV